MRTSYQKLSPKDKRAFIELFKMDAADGPAAAAFCLIELDVEISESEFVLQSVFRDLGWPAAYIERLVNLANGRLTL